MSQTASPRPRVLVLFGGRSGEHPISAVTAGGVLRAIDRSRYDVLAVGITREGRWVLADDDPDRWAITDGKLPEVNDSSARVLLPQAAGDRAVQVLHGPVAQALGDVDVVFPLLHGPFGEDGTVQGMLELADVRYVGAGVLASAVGMDKQMMKLVFAGQGLPVGPFVVVRSGEVGRDPAAVLERAKPLGLPVFVKPARAGSSLGITKVTDWADLLDAVRAAAEHDPKVLVEAAIVGREIECGVLGGRDGAPARASLPGEIVVHGELPTVPGDATLLTALFQNLVGNALKYRDPERAPHIEISATRQDTGDWQFTVRDNGIGIDEQYAERIFTIFQRLHLRDNGSRRERFGQVERRALTERSGPTVVIAAGGQYHYREIA